MVFALSITLVYFVPPARTLFSPAIGILSICQVIVFAEVMFAYFTHLTILTPLILAGVFVLLRGLALYRQRFPNLDYSDGAIRRLAGGFDLRLMSSLNDVSGIPTEGKDLIIVAAVNNVLHFRIFDGDGKVVVDTDEQRLTEQAQQIGDLRKKLESLWPPHELTGSERDQVTKSVTSIVGHNIARYYDQLAMGSCPAPSPGQVKTLLKADEVQFKRGNRRRPLAIVLRQWRGIACGCMDGQGTLRAGKSVRGRPAVR